MLTVKPKDYFYQALGRDILLVIVVLSFFAGRYYGMLKTQLVVQSVLLSELKDKMNGREMQKDIETQRWRATYTNKAKTK